MTAHIAMDARMLGHSGIGTYIANLVPRLVARRPEWRWTLLGDGAALSSLDIPDGANVRIVECRSRIYTVREQFEIAAKRPTDADLFWSPHYNVPLMPGGRLMVTVHDVGHLSLPEFFPGAAQRIYARTMFGAVRLRARAIVCDSQFTRNEYVRLIGAGRADPHIVYPGIDPVWTSPRSRTRPHPRPYVVCVGVVKPHKNVGALVRAFARLRDVIPHDLIVIGPRTGLRTVDEEAERIAQQLGSRVTFVGDISFDALREYVAHAEALVSTSLHEGFGLPPLEAMAAGCPVLVSNVTALPEVCGDAALYCDPRSDEDVARMLQRLLGDAELRRTLIERGRRRAAAFTWERCAQQTGDVMDEVLRSS